MSCGCHFDEDEFADDEVWDHPPKPDGVDSNGYPVAITPLAGTPVTIRHADVPESDITTLNGIRMTTPLRTVIDLASQVDESALRVMVTDCLARRLFTADEAWERLERPDLRVHAGAEQLRRLLRTMR